jgi:hypothetical protein
LGAIGGISTPRQAMALKPIIRRAFSAKFEKS